MTQDQIRWPIMPDSHGASAPTQHQPMKLVHNRLLSEVGYLHKEIWLADTSVGTWKVEKYSEIYNSVRQSLKIPIQTEWKALTLMSHVNRASACARIKLIGRNFTNVHCLLFHMKIESMCPGFLWSSLSPCQTCEAWTYKERMQVWPLCP